MFCFDAQVSSRSASDLSFMGLTMGSQLSIVHQKKKKKVALNIPFSTAIIIVVAFLCAHHLKYIPCMSLALA